MKRFSEQLHKKSQTVKLKKSEQADLRARIVSYMEYHPLPKDRSPVARTKPTVVSEPFAIVRLNFAQWRGSAALVAAIVILAGVGIILRERQLGLQRGKARPGMTPQG